MWDEEDAYDIMEQLEHMGLKTNINILELPGILFWDHKEENNIFLSLRGKSEEDITNLLRLLFWHLKGSPHIATIKSLKNLLGQRSGTSDALRVNKGI